MTIKQPSEVAPSPLDMQIALLRDTLESYMEGRNLSALPDELMENIQQLLKYVHKSHDDQMILLNPVQGSEEDVPGFPWRRRSYDICQHEHPKVASTFLGKVACRHL